MENASKHDVCNSATFVDALIGCTNPSLRHDLPASSGIRLSFEPEVTIALAGARLDMLFSSCQTTKFVDNGYILSVNLYVWLSADEP